MDHSLFKIKGRDIVLLLTGAVLYSIGVHMFVTPANIAPGGAAGVAILINYISGAPVGITTLLLNVPLLILSWVYLSRRFAIMTAFASTVCSLVLDFVVSPVCPIYTGDRLLGSLSGGVLLGIGMALVFQGGMTTGGTDILGYLFQKKMPQFSIGNALLIVDGIILLISVFVFHDLEAALFGLICLYVQTKVIDGILYGGDSGSMATIVTHSADQISRRIIRELDRSATIVLGQGAYSKAEVEIVLSTVRKSQFAQLKQIVHETDPSAFVMVTETSSVFGDGFKSLEETI